MKQKTPKKKKKKAQAKRSKSKKVLVWFLKFIYKGVQKMCKAFCVRPLFMVGSVMFILLFFAVMRNAIFLQPSLYHVAPSPLMRLPEIAQKLQKVLVAPPDTQQHQSRIVVKQQQKLAAHAKDSIAGLIQTHSSKIEQKQAEKVLGENAAKPSVLPKKAKISRRIAKAMHSSAPRTSTGALRHPPAAPRHPPAAFRHPPAALRHPPAAPRHPPAALRHPPAALRHPPAALAHRNFVSPGVVVFVQQALRVFGFDRLRITGQQDRQTASAIAEFQRISGLQPTGAIDSSLIRKMQEFGLLEAS